MTFTNGRRHGQKGWELIFGPDIPQEQQLDFVEEAMDSETHADFAEIYSSSPKSGILIQAHFKQEVK